MFNTVGLAIENTTMVAPYTSLDFGEVDAETEARRRPSLLLKGYFDQFRLAERVEDRSVTVLLGSKGSGKSSILEHIRLAAEHKRFVKTLNVGDLPFTDFMNVKMGDSSRETRGPTAWKFFILSYLLESLHSDPLAECSGSPNAIRDALKALEEQGVRPSSNFNETVLKLSKVTAKVSLPIFEAEVEGNVENKATQRMFLGTVAEQFVKIVETTSSPNTHLLFVDGLDDFYRPSHGAQDHVIAGLIFAAHQLNLRFLDSESPCAVIVACRNEIFDRLPLSNSNRIKQSAGAVVTWAVPDSDAEESELFELATHKVNSTQKKPISDVIAQYFPAEVTVGSGNTRSIGIHRYLLDRTRHIPRDMLRLLGYIQKAVRRESEVLSNRDVVSGAKSYAKDYFLPEVRNELTSTCDKDISEALIAELSKADGHIFDQKYIVQNTSPQRRTILTDEAISAGLSALYQAGAIGCSSGERSRYVNFQFRNDGVGFSETGDFVMQEAFIAAVNAPRKRVR